MQGAVLPEGVAGSADGQSGPLPRVLVTRPQPQADEWVARLQALGQPAAALPLLAIEALPPDAPALVAAWAGLGDLSLLMFVSPNAVLAFFTARPARWAWPPDLLAGATGPGTVAALRSAGVPEGCIAAPPADAVQFDAETLWQHRLARESWDGRRVLVVRASEGRDWLSQTLRERGAQVGILCAYRRGAPRWGAHQVALLMAVAADPAAHVWLVSSSEAIGLLPQLLSDHGMAADAGALDRLRQSRVLATHPRIAQTARAAGFVAVEQVLPDPLAVTSAIRAWAAGPATPA